jgi:hypothetical protein
MGVGHKKSTGLLGGSVVAFRTKKINGLKLGCYDEGDPLFRTLHFSHLSGEKFTSLSL